MNTRKTTCLLHYIPNNALKFNGVQLINGSKMSYIH